MSKAPPKAVIAAYRSDLTAFARKSFLILNPDATWVDNWHIEAICYQLQRVISGRCNRLIVTAPPRTLEELGTEIVAHYEAGRTAAQEGIDRLVTAGSLLIEARSRAPNFDAFLRDHCSGLSRSKKRITVREAGEVRKISQQEAILLALFNQALRGDAKARNSILAMCMKYDPPKPETENDLREEEISDSDQAILDDYVRRHLEDMKGQENEQSPSESDDRGLS